MSIPREFINSLLSRIDIVDLISTEVPLRKKSGTNFFACCPFHNEKTASFSVSQAKQFYYCFGCHAHGNAIDFLMNYQRFTFVEAVEMLAKDAGLTVPQSALPSKPQHFVENHQALEDIAKKYHAELKNHPHVIEYLKQRGVRGLTAKNFLLGFAPNDYHYLSKAGANTKTLEELGMVVQKQNTNAYDRFRDRLMFPIQDHRGRFIGFGGRVIHSGEPKYLNSPETPLFQKGHELYGLYQVLKNHRDIAKILIVEGYMDVIALHQEGLDFAVATLGTATTNVQIERLLRYTNHLVFCFDGDKAGNLAAFKALTTALPLMQDTLKIDFLFLPQGEDPDSLVKKEGKLEFEKRLEKAVPLSQFFLQKLGSESALATLEERSRFAANALEHLKTLKDGLYRNLLLEEIAKRARIPVTQLDNNTVMPASVVEKNTSRDRSTALSPIRLALALLVQNPQFSELIEDDFTNLDVPGFDFLLDLLADIRRHAVKTSAHLFELYRDRKERDILFKLFSLEIKAPEAGLHQEFLGAVRQLTLLGYETKINEFLKKLGQNALDQEEKHELSRWIAKKKALMQPAPENSITKQ